MAYFRKDTSDPTALVYDTQSQNKGLRMNRKKTDRANNTPLY